MSGPSLYPNIRRSSSGYRSNSSDNSEKSLVIPSNKISMCEDDGSHLKKGNIKGTGLTTGNTKIMKPGKNYTFAGDNEVLETPLEFKGANSSNSSCWPGYEKVGTKKSPSGTGETVNDCKK